MTRSWWGWGNEEAAVTGTEAAELEARVAMGFGDHDFTVAPVPDPRALGLPAPRVAPPESLARLASDDVVDRAAHARGKAYRDVVRNLAGDLTHLPDLVLRPESEQDVADVLDWCSGAGVAVIPYGGGSSVVGGVEPRFDAPAVTLDLTRLDRVLEVDRTSRTARIQGGVLGPALEDQLRGHGLTLRHFPQSFEFSTLGGWLATRAGGHFATGHTHIDDLTESIRAVTPIGVTESRRLPGSGAGPSHDRLLLGSEGAFGVITEAWMRLQDRPRWQARVSVRFDDWQRAVDAVRTIAQSGLQPANCRLLDAGEAFLNAGTEVAGGLLVLAFESADHPVEAWLDRALAITGEYGGTPGEVRRREATASTGGRATGGTATEGPATGPEGDSSAAWRSSFIRMPYQRDALARRSVIVETFETACTWDAFAALHAAVTEAANRAVREVTGRDGLVSCRFTHLYPDGPAPYYGVYAPGRRDGLLAQWDEIKHAVSEAIIASGGTITHHHAVGRDHAPYYARQRSEVFGTALSAVKLALDPAGILNPGVLVGEHPDSLGPRGP